MKSRLYEIDLFRFLAALSVVLYHYTFRAYAAHDMSSMSFQQLGSFFRYGYLGVNLFFMISGFVILLTALNKDLIGFAISRIVRLYPTFWASVTLTAVATLFIGGDRYSILPSQYVANLTMVTGYFGIEAIDGVYWTLLVFLKFYFLIAIVIAANYTKKIKYVVGVWATVTLLISFVGAPRVIRFFLFPEWASYFIAGAMFYLIKLEGISPYRFVVITIAYYLSIKYAVLKIPILEGYYSTNFSEYIVVGVISMFYILFFMIAYGKTELLNRKGMLSVGALTYPLYLIHQKIGYMIFNMYGRSINKYLLLLITISLMILLSYAINKYVEPRVSKALKKLLSSMASRIPLTKGAPPDRYSATFHSGK